MWFDWSVCFISLSCSQCLCQGHLLIVPGNLVMKGLNEKEVRQQPLQVQIWSLG